MKYIKLFEEFVNEANSLNKIKSLIPGVKFQEEEIEFDPEEGYKSVESYSFEIPGIDEPAYINIYDGNSFCFFYDAAPIAISLHTGSEKNQMAQQQIEVPKPLNKLNKKIYDEAVANIKEYVGESATNEGNTTLGPKAKKFDSYIQEWDFFSDADDNKLREERLPKEWHDALKKLGVKADDAIVLFFDAHGDRQEVLDIAKKSGIKYIEVPEGDDGGSGGIIFSAKQ
jgi:hypothetical protein